MMKAILLVFFMAVGIVVNAQTSAQSYFNSGAKDFVHSELEKAIATVDNGLKKYPNDENLNQLKEKLVEEKKKEDQKKDQQNKDKKDQQNKDKKKADVNPELDGFEIEINEFGEIKSNMDVDRLNEFLNKHVDDKKLRDRDVDEPEEEEVDDNIEVDPNASVEGEEGEGDDIEKIEDLLDNDDDE